MSLSRSPCETRSNTFVKSTWTKSRSTWTKCALKFLLWPNAPLKVRKHNMELFFLDLTITNMFPERKSKKMAKLHFACQGQGEHCLYSRGFFTMRTRNPRVWIHLMFLALQAKSQSALSSRETSVSSLKNCWDILKCENKSFLTLVTSAFPCSKVGALILSKTYQNNNY